MSETTPTLRLLLEQRVNDAALIRIESTDLPTFQNALVQLGLAAPNPAVAPPAAIRPTHGGYPSTETAPDAAPPKVKTGKAKLTAVSGGVSPEEKAAVTEASPPTPPQEPAAAPTLASVAAAAVRAYGGTNGVQAAKDLLKTLGLASTKDITDGELADKVIEAVEAQSV